VLPYRLPMRRVRPRLSAAVVASLVGLSLALTACNAKEGETAPGGDMSEVAGQMEVPRQRYVAMGDSYTAAPLRPIPERAQACMRSKRNYPRLVTSRLENTKLVDVSCSGASTISLTGKQGFDRSDVVRPPQMDALTQGTDLVTVSIGANDFRLFNSMIYECLDIGKRDPDGAPCREFNNRGKRDRLERTIEKIQPRVTAVIEEIRRRSPDARVLLVGYPQLLPDAGTCPVRMPLADEDYAYARQINQRLAEGIRDAGLRAGAEYVDLYTASQGHDICSDEPWIAGIHGAQRAMGLHPYPEEQQAVADLILGML
jgi:lysophospholipase L1-like esterase